MSVAGTPVGETGNAHLACLHVELRDKLLHIMCKILHTLLRLYLHELLLRTCHTHLSASTPPVEYGKRNGKATVLLSHRSLISTGQGVSRLRQTELEIYVGLQSRIGLCICKVAAGLLAYALIVHRIGAVLHCHFKSLGKGDRKIRDTVGQQKGYECILPQPEK